MKHVVTIQVDLATRPNIVPIEVTIEYHLENDGVGHYEYWGSTGYDEGNTFIEVDEYHYDNSSFTPEEQEQINAEIDSQLDAIVDTISIDSAVDDHYEPEYDTHHDYEYDV
jgi:hypothetical protein